MLFSLNDTLALLISVIYLLLKRTELLSWFRVLCRPKLSASFLWGSSWINRPQSPWFCSPSYWWIGSSLSYERLPEHRSQPLHKKKEFNFRFEKIKISTFIILSFYIIFYYQHIGSILKLIMILEHSSISRKQDWLNTSRKTLPYCCISIRPKEDIIYDQSMFVVSYLLSEEHYLLNCWFITFVVSIFE